jgi:hypothetical protein
VFPTAGTKAATSRDDDARAGLGASPRSIAQEAKSFRTRVNFQIVHLGALEAVLPRAFNMAVTSNFAKILVAIMPSCGLSSSSAFSQATNVSSKCVAPVAAWTAS